MKERTQAALWGAALTGLLALLIVLGSRRLAHFDAALVGYTFATLFATFGITYRYSMWLQRPPTRRYWVRGWQLFLQPRYLGRNLWQLGRRLGVMFALNAFIWKRSMLRSALAVNVGLCHRCSHYVPSYFWLGPFSDGTWQP